MSPTQEKTYNLSKSSQLLRYDGEDTDIFGTLKHDARGTFVSIETEAEKMGLLTNGSQKKYI